MSFIRAFASALTIFGCATIAKSADLPVPEPIEYVRVCDVFEDDNGTKDFHYIPGTDTCLNVGGEVLAEAHYVDGDVEAIFGAPQTDFNNWTSRARSDIRLDSRTLTDFGILRAFIEFETTVGPGDEGSYDDTEPELTSAFIEIANDMGAFTAGRTDSFFDFFSSNSWSTRISIDDSTNEQNVFAYTLNLGEAWRGTLSVEDPASSPRRLAGADDYEGQELPDLIGNIEVEGEEWGRARLMGAARHIHDEDGDGFGWAIGAGLELTLPVGEETTFSMQTGYGKGAIGYVTYDPGGIGDFDGPEGDDTNQAFDIRAGIWAQFTEKFAAYADGSFTRAEADASDYDFWALVGGLSFSPSAEVSMGPEVGYNRLDSDTANGDGDAWGVMWFVNSAF